MHWESTAGGIYNALCQRALGPSALRQYPPRPFPNGAGPLRPASAVLVARSPRGPPRASAGSPGSGTNRPPTTDTYPHPRRRGPQRGARARAAYGPAAAIDRGTEGRGHPTRRGGRYARRTRAQLRRGEKYDFASRTLTTAADARFRARLKLTNYTPARPTKMCYNNIYDNYRAKTDMGCERSPGLVRCWCRSVHQWDCRHFAGHCWMFRGAIE